MTGGTGPITTCCRVCLGGIMDEDEALAWYERAAEAGESGCPNATHVEVVGKIIQLRQNCHFGPEKISMHPSGTATSLSASWASAASSTLPTWAGCRTRSATGREPCWHRDDGLPRDHQPRQISSYPLQADSQLRSLGLQLFDPLSSRGLPRWELFRPRHRGAPRPPLHGRSTTAPPTRQSASSHRVGSCERQNEAGGSVGMSSMGRQLPPR